MADADVVNAFYSYDVFIMYGVPRSMIFCSDKKDSGKNILVPGTPSTSDHGAFEESRNM